MRLRTDGYTDTLTHRCNPVL